MSADIPSSLSLGKTDSVVAQVVDGVPFAEEGITKNDKGAGRRGDVKAGESGDTLALDLENVLVGANGEVVAGERESQIRKG